MKTKTVITLNPNQAAEIIKNALGKPNSEVFFKIGKQNMPSQDHRDIQYINVLSCVEVVSFESIQPQINFINNPTRYPDGLSNDIVNDR